ncbi:MAG: hypothetical protein ACFFDP_06805 [Promethearchaeota archaeon]
MNRKWLGLFSIPIIICSVFVCAILIGNSIPPNSPSDGLPESSLSSYMQSKQPNILAVRILGNSSDIVYPELMEALFMPHVSGVWNVTATFLNDTEGPYNVTFYEEEFQATLTEVENINNAIYTGLDSTYHSSDSINDLMYSIGFGIDILYTDGTWIQLFTIQSPKGHIIFLNGTYTGTPNPSDPFDMAYIERDENWINGVLLEPGTALDELIATMNDVFENHLG